MERESYLRSLPYLHPSSWPAPSSARNHGGAYIRKLIFPRHMVSIEPISSEKGDTLGPAFFLATNDGSNPDDAEADKHETHGKGLPSIDQDPALCPFEASVLVPKSVAGVSPGASSASTALTMSQSPTTPAARKAAAAASGAAVGGISSSNGLVDVTKQGVATTPSPEPILYFRFVRDGTYCVDFSRILNITLEAGGNATSNENDHGVASQSGGNGVNDEANKRGRSVPPSVVISFDMCSFRIFQFGAGVGDSSGEQTQEEQLNNLHLVVNELTASLRAAGTFVAPRSPSTDRGSGDTQSSGRASLEEGGQCDIGLESTCSGSEVKGQSEAKDGDDANTGHLSGDGKDESQPSQQSLASTDSSRKASDIANGPPVSERAEQSKRRRRAYDQSVAAIECIKTLADPLNDIFSTQSRTLATGPGSEKHMTTLMTAAANSLAAIYDTGDGGQKSDAYTTSEVERILTSLDGTMTDFFPVHTRMKHQRGGLSMSSPSAQSVSDLKSEPTLDADELRDSARQMMKEYRDAIVARHMSAILPSR